MAVLWVIERENRLHKTHKTAINPARELHSRDVTHILSNISCVFSIEILFIFIFVGYRNDRFFPI